MPTMQIIITSFSFLRSLIYVCSVSSEEQTKKVGTLSLENEGWRENTTTTSKIVNGLAWGNAALTTESWKTNHQAEALSKFKQFKFITLKISLIPQRKSKHMALIKQKSLKFEKRENFKCESYFIIRF